jgi:hypothetical protein
MRALVVVAGIGMALSGVAVVCHQMLLWQQDGYGKQILFDILWVALGGAAPDLLDVHGIGGMMAWLLGQPLSVILLLLGGSFTRIGIEGISRTPPTI